MSNMKRILEVIESDEELKIVYEHATKMREHNIVDSGEFYRIMQFLYEEALEELGI